MILGTPDGMGEFGGCLVSRVPQPDFPGLKAWRIQRRNRVRRVFTRALVLTVAAIGSVAALPASINPFAFVGLISPTETDAIRAQRAADLSQRLGARPIVVQKSAPPLSDNPAAPLPAPAIASADLGCLARAVHGDARGDNIEVQIAVAQVVLDYASRRGVGVCQAVAKAPRCYFPHTCLLAVRSDVGSGPWLQAVWIAEEVAAGRARLRELAHVERYHSYQVGPDWKASMRRIRRIGGLIFYAPHAAPDPDLSMALLRPKAPWDDPQPLQWVDLELRERQGEVMAHTQTLPLPPKPVVIRRASPPASASRETFNPFANDAQH